MISSRLFCVARTIQRISALPRALPSFSRREPAVFHFPADPLRSAPRRWFSDPIPNDHKPEEAPSPQDMPGEGGCGFQRPTTHLQAAAVEILALRQNVMPQIIKEVNALLNLAKSKIADDQNRDSRAIKNFVAIAIIEFVGWLIMCYLGYLAVKFAKELEGVSG